MRRHSQFGTNFLRVGDYNLLVVFDQIRRARTGISRVEIAKNSGLSVQTISNAVAKLRDLGLVDEGDRVYSSSGPGKPRTMLLSKADAGYAIGAHIDPATLSVVLMDISGKIIRRLIAPHPVTPELTVNKIVQFTNELSLGIPSEKLLGIGCAAPGPVDAAAGTFIDPPTLPGWNQFPLRNKLSEKTGLPAYVQKDSIAAMAAELWHRNRGVDKTTLFVYAGFGVGFAAAHGGELFLGSSGNAGEAGHINVGARTDPCSCGRSGCMGKAIEFRYLVQQAQKIGILPTTNTQQTNSELADAMDKLTTLGKNGNKKANKIIEGAAGALAQGIVVMADFLDATDIVIGGSQWVRLSSQLENAIKSEFEQYSVVKKLHNIEVHGADYGEWVGAAGGASLVFDQEFSPRPSMLTVPGPQNRTSV